ncbi:hypothetical protein AB834_06420 [PVC group bacterium (ex Bugula neritina AB1)]|nr:hypothetical protein AB834_06420 [PVC group bacterium (ex Bugula neritina AB1)]
MIKNFLSKLDFSTIGCVEINDHFVSAFKCSSQGTEPKILSYAIEYFTDSPSSEEIATKIRLILKKCQISARNTWVFLPTSEVMIKEISLPPMDTPLIRKALSFELKSHTPFEISNIFYDFTRLDLSSPHHTHILVSMIPKKQFQKNQDKWLDYGLKSPLIALKPLSLGAYYAYHSKTFKEETVLLIDLTDPNLNYIHIFHEGMLRFSKSFNDHIETSSWQEEKLDSDLYQPIFEQIETALSYYETFEFSSRPKHLKIHTVKDISDPLLDHICKNLQMHNIFLEHTIDKEYILPFGQALSIINGPTHLPLRGEEKDSHFLKKYSSSISYFLAGLLLIQISFLFHPYKYFSKLCPIKKKISQLEPSVKKSKHLQKKLRAEIKKTNTHINLSSKKSYLTFLISILNKYLPPESHITNLSKEDDGKIILKLWGPNKSSVLKSLKLCSHIQSLTVESIPTKNSLYSQKFYLLASFYFSFLQGEVREQK